VIAFRVSVSGRTICTAGTQGGVLNVIVSAVKGRLSAALDLHVSALERATAEHVGWNMPEIRRGDVIEIEVVETNVVDRPAFRHPSNDSYWRLVRRVFVERLRAAFVLARSNPRKFIRGVVRPFAAAATGPFVSPFGFRVAVRNEPVCAAGIRGSGVLITTVIWASRRDGERRDVSVITGGRDPVAAEHLDWPSAALRIGDTVRIEIGDAASAEPPIKRRAVSAVCRR
jgi:hypothetical protein